MESKIVEKLRETKTLSNKILAYNIEKVNHSFVYGRKQARQSFKNDDRAYQLFLGLIDPESSERLRKYDEIIKQLEEKIHRESGWWRTSTGLMYQDNFQNMHDPEFRTFDTYTIHRNDFGYYVSSEKPFNSYFAMIRSKEIEFFERYEEVLKELHTALSIKESIMSGNYFVQDPKNEELCREISIYLGYKVKDLGKGIIQYNNKKAN